MNNTLCLCSVSHQGSEWTWRITRHTASIRSKILVRRPEHVREPGSESEGTSIQYSLVEAVKDRSCHRIQFVIVHSVEECQLV
jgi:hypothetical protein